MQLKNTYIYIYIYVYNIYNIYIYIYVYNIYIYVVYACYIFSLLDFTEIYNGLFYDLKTEHFACRFIMSLSLQFYYIRKMENHKIFPACIKLILSFLKGKH